MSADGLELFLKRYNLINPLSFRFGVFFVPIIHRISAAHTSSPPLNLAVSILAGSAVASAFGTLRPATLS
jgi:hypothetical protein